MSLNVFWSAVTGDAAAEMMEDVLCRSQSPGDAVRGEAEAQFNAAKASPSVCLQVLAVLAPASTDELVWETATVLLRRTAKELWEGVDERMRLGLKNTLLQSIRGGFRGLHHLRQRCGRPYRQGGGCGASGNRVGRAHEGT